MLEKLVKSFFSFADRIRWSL